MALRMWEVGEMEGYDEPVVVLIGSRDDVRKAARHFGRLVEVVPLDMEPK